MIASTFGSTHDFFSSGTWLVVRNLLLFFAFVFWLATLSWIYKDARRRIEDPWVVGVSVLLGVVLPFFGPFIYMLFRPPEYLEDVRERELETFTARCAARRSTRASSSARSARRSSSSRARTARLRSRRSGRSAPIARRRSSRRRSRFPRSSLEDAAAPSSDAE